MKKEVKSNLILILFVISLVLLVFIGNNLSGKIVSNEKKFKILDVKENTNGVIITLENINSEDIPGFKVVFEGKSRLERNLLNGFNSNENEKEFLVSINNIEDYNLINVYPCLDIDCGNVIEGNKESYSITSNRKQTKAQIESVSFGPTGQLQETLLVQQPRIIRTQGPNGESLTYAYTMPNFLPQQQEQRADMFPYAFGGQQIPQEFLQDNIIYDFSEQEHSGF